MVEVFLLSKSFHKKGTIVQDLLPQRDKWADCFALVLQPANHHRSQIRIRRLFETSNDQSNPSEAIV